MKFAIKVNIEKTAEISFPTPKTTAHKFVKQFSTVQTGDTKNNIIEKPSLGDQSVFGVRDLKKISIKKGLNSKIESLTRNPELKIRFQEKRQKRLEKNDVFQKKPEELFNEVLNRAISQIVDELIKNADLAESLLDLSFKPDVEVELDFIIKLEEIVVDLDKALKEADRLVEKKKNESIVRVPIKRFDIRDIRPKNV